MRPSHPPIRWAKYFVGFLSLLCVAPAQADLINQQIDALEGPRVSIDGQLGIRCSRDAGDSPGLYVRGGTIFDEAAIGAGIVIPFHSNPGDCKKIVAYEEALARLTIAERLLERGLISMEDYKRIADETYQIIARK